MAEIYGSFGRVITGNTLGGSIGSLARQILADKISRVFNAYRDEVQYEGSLLDAASAISRLTEMLAMVDPNSDAAKDIKEYVDAIRQEDRSRRAKKAVNTLDLAGAENKDYPTLIKTLKEILADPTITETEKEAYKAAIANQTRYYINNIMKQFNEGGSITVGGKSIDFGLTANHDQLTSIISGLMTDNPEMRTEIGKAFDQSKAMVMLKAADFDFANNKDISNKGRADAYAKLQKATQEAYNMLSKSEFDLANSGMALDLLQSVTKYSEYIKDYKEAAASEYAAKYVQDGITKATSYFDAVDKFASNILGAATDATTGGAKLSDLVANGDIDAIYDYLDLIAGNNGGSTNFTLDGKTYSISRDTFFQEVKTTGKIYTSLDDFSSGNKNVHADDQKVFDGLANRYNLLVQGKEIFSIEDRYDAARETLKTAVRKSNGDIFAIRDAYVKFGQSLSGMASQYGPDSIVYDNLMLESQMYINGDVPEDSKLFSYGVVSGNFDMGTAEFEAYAAAPFIAHDMANNSSRYDLETFVSFDGNRITMATNFAGDALKTEFGDTFSRPSWSADGIKTKGTTGSAEVHQIISLQDAKGVETGWIAWVNGKFVGGTRSGTGTNTSYTIRDSATLTRALAALGIDSPEDMRMTFTPGGMVVRGLGINSTAGVVQISGVSGMQLRDGGWEAFGDTGRAEGSGLSMTDKEYAADIAAKVKAGEIKMLPPAPSYAQQSTADRVMVKDSAGNWVRASAILDQSMVQRLLDNLNTIQAPGTEGPLGGNGGGGVGMGVGGGRGGSGMTIGRGLPEYLANRGYDEKKAEEEYMARRNTGTSVTKKPDLTAGVGARANIDLGYGETPGITKPPSTGITTPPPLTGGTSPGLTPPLLSSSPTKLTSQALVDFRAGERAPLTTTSKTASTAVGGFFRNSPFRISL
jgi:hypothetical protein